MSLTMSDMLAGSGISESGAEFILDFILNQILYILVLLGFSTCFLWYIFNDGSDV